MRSHWKLLGATALILSAACVSYSLPPPVFDTSATGNVCMCWTPTAAEIDRYGKEVLQGNPPPVGGIGELGIIKGLPEPLDRYKRVYAGIIENFSCIYIPSQVRPAPFSDEPVSAGDPCPSDLQSRKVLTGTLKLFPPGESAAVTIREAGKAPVLQD